MLHRNLVNTYICFWNEGFSQCKGSEFLQTHLVQTFIRFYTQPPVVVSLRFGSTAKKPRNNPTLQGHYDIHLPNLQFLGCFKIFVFHFDKCIQMFQAYTFTLLPEENSKQEFKFQENLNLPWKALQTNLNLQKDHQNSTESPGVCSERYSAAGTWFCSTARCSAVRPHLNRRSRCAFNDGVHPRVVPNCAYHDDPPPPQSFECSIGPAIGCRQLLHVIPTSI